ARWSEPCAPAVLRNSAPSPAAAPGIPPRSRRAAAIGGRPAHMVPAAAHPAVAWWGLLLSSAWPAGGNRVLLSLNLGPCSRSIEVVSWAAKAKGGDLSTA
ncbi:unnamed protein product, partial [Prorocentrum cordatum]